MSALLEIRDLSCRYGEVQVLHRLSLQLEKGEVHCLLGRNGAGKTTTRARYERVDPPRWARADRPTGP
jgi:ABC-type branched-subunit amino acid transport system ATPase component